MRRISEGLATLSFVVSSAVCAQAENVALFNDGSFVDTGREATNLHAALSSLGHTVAPFTGIGAADWTAATAGADVLVIPELERGNLMAALSPSAIVVIQDYIDSGGSLITNNSTNPAHNTHAVQLLNGLFGFSLVGTGGGSSTLNPVAAAGTVFEGGPATLPNSNATEGVTNSSLPPDALDLYNSGSSTTVFAAAYGSGDIVHLGFDWWELPSPPAWVTVLGSAVMHAGGDDVPPEITVTLDRSVLWPPNHRLADVVATVTVTDDTDPDPTFVLTSIESNEPDNGTGDGDEPDDIQDVDVGTADVDFRLRSERSGGGDGRVYTIAYTASDEAGNTAEATVEAFVPHDRSGDARGADGFSDTGEEFDPTAVHFALVLLTVPPSGSSGPGFDATQVPVSEAYVGNTAGALRPLEAWTSDIDKDGHDDVAFFYSIEQVMLIEAESDAVDGPLGMHYESGLGDHYLVPDIFALGAPIDLEYAPVTGVDDVTGVEPPRGAVFSRAYPNPFESSVALVFSLGREDEVRLTVYDTRGAKVRTLVAGRRPAGRHEVLWNGRDDSSRALGSGVYFARLVAGEYRSTRRIVLIQ